MRTALVLLFLLALAAVPGSLVPQRGIDAGAGRAVTPPQHPTSAPWLDRLSLFDVYSLAVVRRDLPAAVRLARRLRRCRAAGPHLRGDARPGRRARRATSAGCRCTPTCDDATRRRREVLAAAARALRGAAVPGRRRATTRCRAEKGYLRETGNLVFHLSLLVLLVAVALGHLFGYKGNVLVVEGEAFSNTVVGLRHLRRPGALADERALRAVHVRPRQLTVRYQPTGDAARRAARLPGARSRYTTTPDAAGAAVRPAGQPPA